MHEVTVAPAGLGALAAVVGDERAAALDDHLERLRSALGARTVVTVNTTRTGGGVAEMLGRLVGYANGAGVRTRWLVIGGTPPFYAVTKRLHNALHGSAGDGADLGADEQEQYARHLEREWDTLRPHIGRDDVVVLHDPQTAGLAPLARAHGATVVWRCHIGTDRPNARTERAWEFLRPHLDRVDAVVCSRYQHAPPFVPGERVAVIPPAVDPLSAKNAPMTVEEVHAVLGAAGILPHARVSTSDCSGAGRIVHPARVVRDGPPPAVERPMVLQVSRWDHLKDMPGVMTAFTRHLRRPATGPEPHLVLAGPSTADVPDDPEGRQVFDDCVAAWHALPPPDRGRVALVELPMDDVDENALMVNALQRHASVIVQKSLAEGFGLTVTEGMLKGRPVVAGAVGGIADQIVDGRSGVLLPDPADLPRLGRALRELLDDPGRAAAIGAEAARSAHRYFLHDRQMTDWATLLERAVRR